MQQTPAPSHPQPQPQPRLADPGLRLGFHVRGEEDHGQVQHDGHPQTDPRQHVGHPPWAVVMDGDGDEGMEVSWKKVKSNI